MSKATSTRFVSQKFQTQDIESFFLADLGRQDRTPGQEALWLLGAEKMLDTFGTTHLIEWSSNSNDTGIVFKSSERRPSVQQRAMVYGKRGLLGNVGNRDSSNL